MSNEPPWLQQDRAEAMAAPAPTPLAVYSAGLVAAHRRCIYALVDPRSPAVVAYVGMTTGHPLVRLEGHLREALPKRDRRRGLPVPRRTTWLRELLADGVHPQLMVLELVAEDGCLEDCEQKWIRFFVLRGEARMNGQMRGAALYGMQR